jgi:hypothetical protein
MIGAANATARDCVRAARIEANWWRITTTLTEGRAAASRLIIQPMIDRKDLGPWSSDDE